MQVECGCAIFGKHLKFSTMHCRKCNFVLMDVEVGLLLTFLASMKAKVCLYLKQVSVFRVYTGKVSFFQVIIFKVSGLVSGFRSLRFVCALSSFLCKQTGKMSTMSNLSIFFPSSDVVQTPPQPSCVMLKSTFSFLPACIMCNCMFGHINTASEPLRTLSKLCMEVDLD